MIKPNPMMIPRFNIDYGTKDLISSVTHLKTQPDFAPISSIFQNIRINYTNSGRTSLCIILRSLGLPEKSKIGVPLYTCPSVFDAIINAGHTPVFLDIDPDNYTLSPQHLSEKIDYLDAVVVIHTFGRPADLDKIQKIAGDKPVIEDCAHALLSKYKEKIVGTIATAGFFSFRTGKYISAGEGGMIATRNQELAMNLEHEIEKLPGPSFINEIKNSCLTYSRSILYHRPWFGLVSLPVGSCIGNKVDLMNKYSFEATRIRKTDMHVISNKMKNFKEKVERQRKNSQYMIQQLKDLDLKLPFEAKDTYCNYYMFPILLKSEAQRDKINKYLLKNGIDTAALFSKTPEIARQNYGYREYCENTEDVAKRILVVPNYYTLNQADIGKIINAIKGGFQV